MPFTPFHLGPAALIKALAGPRFSFMIFGGSQVLMDLEPFVRINRGDAVLHGYSHTLGGALIIGGIAAVIGRPITSLVLRFARADRSTLTWRRVLLSAYIGTYSHILLDGIMHADMRPLWPFTTDNPLLEVVIVTSLHMFCVVTAVVGGTIMLVRGYGPSKGDTA